MKSPKLLIIYSGLFLIVVGVILIGVQVYVQISMPSQIDGSWAEIPRGLKFKAQSVEADVYTTYIGLMLVIAGVFLEVIGLVFGSKDTK